VKSEYSEESKLLLSESLKTGKVIVCFTKVDGKERRMLCTLSEELIPKKKEPKIDESGVEKKPKKVRKVNPNIMPVWDLEAEGWRSFRIDSIKYFENYKE